jgi:dipeptidyl aminopeptidase/acylaminoacyl peptidase
MTKHAAFGSWPSAIPAELLVTGAALPSDVHAEGGTLWWSQSRPDQGGRQQVVRRDPDGTVVDALPDGFNARTRVHEYGGAPWWVKNGSVFANSWADQRVYRCDADGTFGVLTPEPPHPHGFRYADGVVTPDGATVVCVRETHNVSDSHDVTNEVVSFAASGDAEPSAPAVLVSGPDFVAAPRVSRDGTQLAWLQWNHPNMPWDSTELWVADLSGVGNDMRADNARRVAGQTGESVVQPEWGPDGALYVVSDRSDWWNVYRVNGVDDLQPLNPVEAEIGQPAWVFGQSRYVVADDGAVWMTYSDEQGCHLVGLGPDAQTQDLLVDALGLGQLRWSNGRVVAIARSFTNEPEVASYAVSAASDGRAPATVLYPARELDLDPRGIAIPRHITFPSAAGRVAHGWFYPPTGVVEGEVLAGLDGELPPLVVMIHGGPTSEASASFNLGVQFWTSRGFAVVDVDYGGSTGYGRKFRRLLDDAWGIVDVDDACAAATWLAEQRLVDPTRLAIRGGSAGGFTVLAALATRDTFHAGADLFGVADLGALARDTHKFESRYLDGLVGPYPADEAIYIERSPLSHVDGFDKPLIVFQGLEDEVVPPAQSEMIVAALKAKGVPHAYLPFEGEQHGFRIAKNIIRCTTAELYFYSRVFGFELADDIEPVEIVFAEKL